MGQFLYFATGGGHDPAAHDLSYAFEQSPSFADFQAGPGNAAGVMFSAAADAIRFPADNHDWEERDDGVWIGRDLSVPITPLDVQRAEPLPGVDVKLADGQMWHVPRLRTYLAECGFVVAIPQRMRRTKEGWRPSEVLPEWATADKVARELLDRMVMNAASDEQGRPDATGTMSVEDGLRLASGVLAVNYRVSEYELGMLGALASNETLVRVLRTAIDYDTAEADALGKLQALAASSASSGDES